jgi:hypothetical protein
VELNPFYTQTCILNNLPLMCEFIITLLYSPLKRKTFYQSYGNSPRSLVGYVGFACAMHLYPYSMDSCLCPCHEPFCSLLKGFLSMLTTYTIFIPTVGTLVQTHAMNLCPFIPRTLIHARIVYLLISTTWTFVRACATILYRTPPSALIPLVREIDTYVSLLVSP